LSGHNPWNVPKLNDKRSAVMREAETNRGRCIIIGQQNHRPRTSSPTRFASVPCLCKLAGKAGVHLGGHSVVRQVEKYIVTYKTARIETSVHHEYEVDFLLPCVLFGFLESVPGGPCAFWVPRKCTRGPSKSITPHFNRGVTHLLSPSFSRMRARHHDHRVQS
jgi:hypothetical protein